MYSWLRSTVCNICGAIWTETSMLAVILTAPLMTVTLIGCTPGRPVSGAVGKAGKTIVGIGLVTTGAGGGTVDDGVGAGAEGTGMAVVAGTEA